MKKITLLGLVLVLLAFSVAPVMAAGPNNGHGKGNSAGQSNRGGDQNQTRQQDKAQTRINNQSKHSNQGVGKSNQLSKGMPFYLQGTITGVFSDTITIDVNHGNATVKKFFNSAVISSTFTDTMTNTLTVKLSGTTKIFKITQGDDIEGTESTAPSTNSTDADSPGNRVPTTLAVNDIVAIHGKFVGGVFTATLITVYSQGIGGLPETEQP